MIIKNTVKKFFENNDINISYSNINDELIIDINSGIENLRNLISFYKYKPVKNNYIKNFWTKLLAIGLSDISNHKILNFFYKLRKST